MAIYRADQTQLTFGVEAAPGGYAELASSVTDGTGTALINNSAGYAAGTRTLTVDSLSGLTAGEFIQIGPEVSGSGTSNESEVRMVEYVDGSTSITLDAPTAFFHPDNTNIQVVTAVADTDADKYITQIPGVYETVDLPDPEMIIEPRYFLGTASKRNFYNVYSGQQTYTGSLGSFVILNGRALRFPIGQVTTTPSATASDTILLNGAAKKGDVFITCDGADVGNIAVNDYIQIIEADGTKSEVRKVLADASDTFKLDYPLQFDHADNAVINEVSSSPTYTHLITETTDLDSITWHAHMKASNSAAVTAEDEDFDRRYFGGKVGNATISADEGGMLMMSWDSVNFLGMIHNQKTNSNFGSGSTNVPFYSLMKTVTSSNVNLPSTDPYYFSQGEVTIFGQTIARIRSFSISINNNEEPRYYVSKQLGRRRGPTEIREQRREYTMSVSLALPDALSATNTSARTLFTELLLEGDYGSGKAGFDVSLVFTRGSNDTITINVPDSTAGTGGNNQGAFIRTAPHDFGAENPFQVDADILFRNMKITVVDSEHYYP
tara:strand:- start:663 stop:2312 length:1650 start_codon:yes stop_codon:yes gene_type:complete